MNNQQELINKTQDNNSKNDINLLDYNDIENDDKSEAVSSNSYDDNPQRS